MYNTYSFSTATIIRERTTKLRYTYIIAFFAQLHFNYNSRIIKIASDAFKRKKKNCGIYEVKLEQ